MKDSKGRDIEENQILFNPFFMDMWVVTRKNDKLYAILINKGHEEPLENVCDSFYIVGKIGM